jgi:hypothetical protein
MVKGIDENNAGLHLSEDRLNQIKISNVLYWI